MNYLKLFVEVTDLVQQGNKEMLYIMELSLLISEAIEKLKERVRAFVEFLKEKF